MPRYIDAEHLIQTIRESKELSNWGKNVALSLVMDTPVADVVKVVRCKDCVAFKTPSVCGYWGQVTHVNNFCAMGATETGGD